jgi:small subunit ribosomal protein S8
MSMTDPIADYLTRVRNAIKAEKKTVNIPLSKFKLNITEVLSTAKFVDEYKIVETDGKKFIQVKLKYSAGAPVIGGLRRISRPGIRRYVSYEKIPRVRNGLGIAIISTSKGLLTDKQARSLKIGGEVVCNVW